MPDGLYERDALAWSEEQSRLLRRLADGERVNDAIDWPNVIEEIHDVGQAQFKACESVLRQAMIHLLKLHAWPTSTGVPGWRHEVGTFLDDAESRFTPSMRQHLDLAQLYTKALRRLADATDEAGVARAVPRSCPWSLEELLAGGVPDLLARMCADD